MANPYPFLKTNSTASISGVNPTLLTELNRIGQNLGKTITIISGYRSPSYSAKVGGYANDPHTRGEAVDAYIDGNPIGDVVPLETLSRLGLQGGNQPNFYNGKTDPEHVQIPGSGVDKSMVSPDLTHATGVAATGNVPPSDSTNQWPQSAALAYNLALKAGLSPQQAKDFATVQYGESGFDPNARNKQSGAAGLYQLLSQGYVDKANSLGGVFDPTANIQAILPDYVKYYKSHPDLVPGAAGAAVEKSGKGPDYYAMGYQHLPGMPGSTSDSTTPTTTLTPTSTTAPSTTTPTKPPGSDAVLNLLMSMSAGPQYKPVNLSVGAIPQVGQGSLPTSNFQPFVPKALDFSQVPRTPSLMDLLPK